MFNIRAVSLDHYICKPIDELYEKDGSTALKEWQEPVLRIFGGTADGIKSCVHVHGAYPYIYVPYKGGENSERDALLLGAALDEALRTSLNPKIFRFVHEVTLVSGIPLYGYHSKHRQFFKIYFYNPFHIKKASELLLSGAVLGQKFQPHEAHIPYALQFMMDYNIYGMNFVAFSKVKYRRNPSHPESLTNIKGEDILSEKVKKMTWSHLEVDAWASDILNRSGQRGIGVNPGLQAIWEDEQARRRALNRTSQITLQHSQSRPNVTTHPTEALYKARLAQKLAEISLKEPRKSVASEEPTHSYPAEVPKNKDLLEASAIDEGVERPRVRQNVGDVSLLIDERILTQMSGSGKEEAESESEDEMEFDSVLGRNQKPAEEAELEDEDEEGVDMTQPLEPAEERVGGAEGECRRQPGCSSGEGEVTFWKNMAEKIFQLDGAQESSSESEAEACPPEPPLVHCTVSDGAPELSSSWSTNIMSILSECSDCPTPSVPCSTPRTFWFDYSSDLLPSNQEPWSKNVAHFSDVSEKDQESCLDGHFAGGSKEVVPGEAYGEPYAPTAGDYFPLPSLCGGEPSSSPPSTNLTSSAQVDDSSGVHPDPVYGNFHGPLREKRKFPCVEGKFAEPKLLINGKPENDQQKVLQVLKNFSGRKVPFEDCSGHLTLKEYIKDCKEIVSVDFKNLCNREMIIIEYKSQNKRSLRNKYLIKPLDKFLESWDSAERRASDRKDGDEKNLVKEFDVDAEKKLRSNYVINVLEKRFSDASTVQSMSNKVTVKSMEILPDGGNCKDRSHNVNENVISRGEIKMKLIKSQRENVEENVVGRTVKRRRDDKCQRLNLKRVEVGNEKTVKQRKDKLGNRGGNIRDGQKLGKCQKWKNFTEPDTKLISEINSSFEEYFKSIVKRKNVYSKRKNNIIGTGNCEGEGDEGDEHEEEDEEEEGKEETSEDENANAPPRGKRAAQGLCPPSNADSIKFVTRFLSTFSQMSDMPPLSITIRLGNSGAFLPVKVNLRPPATSSGRRVRRHGKKCRRRTRIESLDGAADGSTSDGSESGDPCPAPRQRSRSRREGGYAPLNVIACGSSRGKKRGRRKRKISSCGDAGTDAEEDDERKGFSVQSSGGREKSKLRSSRGEEKNVNASRSVAKRKRNLVPLSEFSSDLKARNAEMHSAEELDFIGDSDEERQLTEAKTEVRSLKCERKGWRAAPKGIPQADTEAVTTSDDETHLFVEKMNARGRFSQKTQPGPPEEGSTSSSAEAACGPASLPLDCMTREQQSLLPETSLCLGFVGSDSSEKHSPAHFSLSPFTLSGSPLLDSKNDSPEPELSASSKSNAKEPVSPESHRRLASSDGSEFSFGKRILAFHNADNAGTSCVPSGEDWSVVDCLNTLRGCSTITPKRNPLSRRDVAEAVQRCDIVESEEMVPFYGNPMDVAKALDTGFRVLKVQNRSVAGLKPFKSSLDIAGVEERRSASLRGQKASRWHLVENKDSTIMPLMKPPPRETLLKTLFVKEEADNLKKTSEKARLRIMEPQSPGQEMKSDDEMELSLTISNFSLEGGNCLAEGTRDLSRTMDAFEPEAYRKKKASVEIESDEKSSAEKKSEESAGDGRGALSRPLLLGGTNSSKEEKTHSKEENSFQIRGVTANDTFGFSRSVQNMENANLSDTHQYMSMLVMELHVQTRKDLRPDPEYDAIRALFYAMDFDSPARGRASGTIVVGEGFLLGTALPDHYAVHYVPTEKALLEKFLVLVREWDPEILTGYEIEMHSWGYLVQRGFVLEMNLLLLLGRVQSEEFTKKNSLDFQRSGDDEDNVPRSVRHMRISGRIVLDAWRVLRHEIALTSYTFENVMYHLSHERHPRLSYERLSHYWEHPSRRFRHLVVQHFATRVLGLIRILDRLDFVNRTSELSRIFGIQFYEVLSRGSQFRVESMMLRLAKPLNYVAASPSVSQRASMRAPASLPLILEPESLFYTDPVIVLDFQSLYPSIIIAYNYCFSTCLGRVEKLGSREPFEFGCTQLQISPEELKHLEEDVSISPAGVAFVKSNIRKGILPAMLEKILETRLMVKKSMKENKGNKMLQKILFARQLGLKLIANVTYGYTAANFSGRMPCIEVGDSVVSKGRETLHRAIQLVKKNREWDARVVYGDTDSIFVLTPGRSREEAFRIGAEIAEAVTRDNPKPVKLKLEKVYQPSILQTKKRYVGYMFESPDQKTPVFEAKGIETVRRDGCPAIGKILEKALRILFDTRDVSMVKKYTLRQFSKLYRGSVNVQDLIFAKEYRGRNGYRAGACVPALHLAKQWCQYDKRAEPRVKERVPYVVVNGPPGVPLIRLVRSPVDLIVDPSLRINAVYYITKAIIPPMQRCFSLLGADVASWYAEMPRKHGGTHKWNCVEGQKRNTISQYFTASECIVCSEVTTAPVCDKCEKEPQALAVVATEKIRRWERCHEGLIDICRSCCGRPTELDCVSLDCPVLFRRKQAARTAERRLELLEILTRYL